MGIDTRMVFHQGVLRRLRLDIRTLKVGFQTKLRVEYQDKA